MLGCSTMVARAWKIDVLSSFIIICLWGNFRGLLSPRGTTYTPLRGIFLHSLSASSNVVTQMFLQNSYLAIQPVKFGCKGAKSESLFVYKYIYIYIYIFTCFYLIYKLQYLLHLHRMALKIRHQKAREINLTPSFLSRSRAPCKKSRDTSSFSSNHWMTNGSNHLQSNITT